MADLKDYIKATLSEITEALVEFAGDAKESGASPNPDGLRIDPNNGKFMGATVQGQIFDDVVAIIDFDVAVTAEETTSKKGGVGIKVMSAFSASGSAESEVVGSSVSRMKFSVPLKLPRVERKTETRHHSQQAHAIMESDDWS